MIYGCYGLFCSIELLWFFKSVLFKFAEKSDGERVKENYICIKWAKCILIYDTLQLNLRWRTSFAKESNYKQNFRNPKRWTEGLWRQNEKECDKKQCNNLKKVVNCCQIIPIWLNSTFPLSITLTSARPDSRVWEAIDLSRESRTSLPIKNKPPLMTTLYQGWDFINCFWACQPTFKSGSEGFVLRL